MAAEEVRLDTESDVASLKVVERSRPIPRKVLALIVVGVLVSSVAFVGWFFYLRHWSIEEVADQVIKDPTLAEPGFKHSLAGKSVVVDGRVTNISEKGTSLGTFAFVELDDYDLLPLVVWGTPNFEIGDRISFRVHFEWSVCNDESHVYSPELAFPNFYTIPSIEINMRAVNFVANGAGLDTSQLENGDVMVKVNFVNDPIPLDLVNCSMRAGHHSWTGEYVDILGEPRYEGETDRIPSLAETIGEKGIIHFTDSNVDGFLDEGDCFVLKNLTRPTTDSGFKTYVMTIGWPLDPDGRYNVQNGFAICYLPIVNRGLFRYNDADTPGARIVRSSIPSGYEFRVVSADGVALDWDNVTAELDAGMDRVEWEIPAEELTGVPDMSKRYPAVTLGDYSVLFNLTDAQGDGLLNEGDRFSFSSEGTSFSNDTPLSTMLLSESSGGAVCHGRFPSNTTPSSRTSTGTIPSGVKLTFGSPHTGSNMTYEEFDVPWRELRITLSDGIESVSWTLGQSDLYTGTGDTLTLSSATLGSLTILCNVSDIQGNGHLNGWDSLTVTTMGTERFSSSVTYTINVTYLPAPNELCSVSFTG